MPITIGINGLGRIGRAILRIVMSRRNVEVVIVNDINPDIHNMAYLIQYDSTFGQLNKKVTVQGDHITIGNEKSFQVFHKEHIDLVPWEKEGVDIVIDSSGIQSNLIRARSLAKSGIRQCIVTNSPPEGELDKFIVMGVNHEDLDPEKDFLVSGSVCDANAFAPVADVLDREFGVEHGFLTTLHPWLNYQNVLDGPSISYATPDTIHDNYALGRGSTASLIPKTTSAITSSCKVLKNLRGRFLSMSYRVPTTIVTSADLSVKLKKPVSIDLIKAIFEEEERNQKWKIFHNSKEALVSTDFCGSEYSVIIDHRWIMRNSENYIKLVLWYDNEWGYSSRIVDLVEYIGNLSRS